MRLGPPLVCVLFILTACAPIAIANPSRECGYAIYITYPEGDYDVGDEVEVTFEVDQSVAPDDDDNGTPGMEAIVMLLALMGAALYRRRTG